jgi:hypothetical protein
LARVPLTSGLPVQINGLEIKREERKMKKGLNFMMRKTLRTNFIAVSLTVFIVLVQACNARTAPAAANAGGQPLEESAAQPIGVDRAVSSVPRPETSVLDGTWVYSFTDSVNGTGTITTTLMLDNGNFEKIRGSDVHYTVFRQRGTYSADAGKITFRPTHIFGDGSALIEKWFTESEVRAEAVHREAAITDFFRAETWDYSLSAIGLTVVKEGQSPVTYTRGADRETERNAAVVFHVTDTIMVGTDWYSGGIIGDIGTTRYYRVRFSEGFEYIINWYDMDFFPGMGAWTDIEVGLINETTGLFVQNFVNHTTPEHNTFSYTVPQGASGYYFVAVRSRINYEDISSFHLRVWISAG